MYEINKLIGSHHKTLKELGWILYNCNAHELGISKEELSKVITIISEGYEKDLDDAHEEGRQYERSMWM